MTKNLFLHTILLIGGVFFIIGCTETRKLDLHVETEVRVPPRRVIVFFADGLWADRCQWMMEDGQLPNIKRYLIDRGCHVENAVSVIPSITYAAIASAQTGCFPGHHQILANKWFDRTSGQYQNYICARNYQRVDTDLRATTIFELLPDKYTVTIQTANRRGATRTYDNWMSSGINWFFHNYLQVDQLVADRFEEIARCTRSTGRWPDYIFAYFPAIDHVGHEKGACSREYQRALTNLDRQIGRICQALESNGMLDQYYLILVSDHGHEHGDNKKRWLPEQYIRKVLGMPVVDRTFLENGNSCQWHEYLRKYRVVLVDGGPRHAQIFLRCEDNWFDMPTYDQVRHFLRDHAPAVYERMGRKDIVELLAENPALAVVTVRMDEKNVYVKNSNGSARVTREIDSNGRKTYRYQIIDHDPLDYMADRSTGELIDGKFYDGQRWLEASCLTDYPDFIPQIVEMYDSRRAGQITIFAREGWDFNLKDQGGHGSVVRNDMIVPFIVAGPGIRRGQCLKTARIVDLMPTVLDMLGCSDRLKQARPIDGRSLLPQLTTKPAKPPLVGSSR